MRKVLFLGAATLLAGIVTATPASAQYYPAPPAYGSPYGAPYGNAYGYHNNWGHVRALQARVDQLQRRIQQLDRRNILSNREANRLRHESREIEHRLWRSARNGLNQWEARNVEIRIARLEQRIQREAWDRDRRGRGYGYGYGHDRDGDWDRRGRGRDRDDD